MKLSLQLLAMLCASNSHCNDAFDHIKNYRFSIKPDIKILLLLSKVTCELNIHMLKNEYIVIANYVETN